MSEYLQSKLPAIELFQRFCYDNLDEKDFNSEL